MSNAKKTTDSVSSFKESAHKGNPTQGGSEGQANTPTRTCYMTNPDNFWTKYCIGNFRSNP